MKLSFCVLLNVEEHMRSTLSLAENNITAKVIIRICIFHC